MKTPTSTSEDDDEAEDVTPQRRHSEHTSDTFFSEEDDDHTSTSMTTTSSGDVERRSSSTYTSTSRQERGHHNLRRHHYRQSSSSSSAEDDSRGEGERKEVTPPTQRTTQSSPPRLVAVGETIHRVGETGGVSNHSPTFLSGGRHTTGYPSLPTSTVAPPRAASVASPGAGLMPPPPVPLSSSTPLVVLPSPEELIASVSFDELEVSYRLLHVCLTACKEIQEACPPISAATTATSIYLPLPGEEELQAVVARRQQIIEEEAALRAAPPVHPFEEEDRESEHASDPSHIPLLSRHARECQRLQERMVQMSRPLLPCFTSVVTRTQVLDDRLHQLQDKKFELKERDGLLEQLSMSHRVQEEATKGLRSALQTMQLQLDELKAQESAVTVDVEAKEKRNKELQMCVTSWRQHLLNQEDDLKAQEDTYQELALKVEQREGQTQRLKEFLATSSPLNVRPSSLEI